ncbi:hypothetical protein POTOM_022842 [Populus tomentosa]|uniref:Thioredoxin superfamily protein n=1 Tax=Populus tomentosa TaxID=118781 RepID=A0A8X7ZM72_POPTO|nr:hypothetical protein POTOM_022842 [Populus tomentosa]
MEEKSFLDRMLGHLRETCKYSTGYPKDLGPSRVIHFTSEREFVQLLHQGYPVVVAFTIRGNYTKHLDQVLEVAAAEFYPQVKFLRVECPKYPGFCITRQRKEYPFIEIFHSPEQVIYSSLPIRLFKAATRGRVAGPNITKYSVKALPRYSDKSQVDKAVVFCLVDASAFNYDLSAYGFREFFKRHGIQSSREPK